MRLRKTIPILLCLFILKTVHSQAIVIDEDFNDWDQASSIYTEPGDNNTLDIEEVQIANDDNFIYFRIKLSKAINLQNDNSLRLLLDSDNDFNTGSKIFDIGAELIYSFGDRSGIIDQNIQIGHSDIELFSLPTVSSKEFEIAISIESLSRYVTVGPEMKFYFQSFETAGDLIPDINTTLEYSLKQGIASKLPNINIEIISGNSLRILSYNVERDNLFNTDLDDSYSNILKTIAADILCFQEIYDHSAQDVLERLEDLEVIHDTRDWFAEKGGNDLICVSKYPILNQIEVAGNSVLELEFPLGTMVIFNCHLPCCDNEQPRTEEIDELLSFLNKSLEGETAIEIPNGTPYIFLGDMNLVGQATQLNSLITGDISDNNKFGPDPRMDYGDGMLTDAKPPTLGYPACFTWQNNDGSFPPGRLDFMLYTDSVLDEFNSFTLNTLKMPQEILDEYGLTRKDTGSASDHLPVICDFEMPLSSTQGHIDAKKIELYPNPVNNKLNIVSDYALNSITIYDNLGLKRLAEQIPGLKEHQMEITELESGLYYCTVSAGMHTITKKILVK